MSLLAMAVVSILARHHSLKHIRVRSGPNSNFKQYEAADTSSSPSSLSSAISDHGSNRKRIGPLTLKSRGVKATDWFSSDSSHSYETGDLLQYWDTLAASSTSRPNGGNDSFIFGLAFFVQKSTETKSSYLSAQKTHKDGPRLANQGLRSTEKVVAS